MSTHTLNAALADICNDFNALDARHSPDDVNNLGPCVQFAFNGAGPQPDTGACNDASAEECIRQIGGVRPPLLPRLREFLKAQTKAKKPLPAKPGDPTQPDDHWIASQIGTTAQTLRKLDRPFRKMIKDTADEVGLEPSPLRPRREPRSVTHLLDQWEQNLIAADRRVPASQVRRDEPDFPRIEREIDVGGGVLTNPKMPYRARIIDFSEKHGLEKMCQIIARPMNLSELKATACRAFEVRLKQEGKDEKQIENALSNLKWACGVAESYSQGGSVSAAAAIGAAIAHRSKQPKADRVIPELNKLLLIVEAADLSAGLPQEFPLALKIAIDRSPMSLAMIARLVDIDKTVLREWTTGRLNPTAESVKVVPKIEELLCLPVGTLSDRHRLSRRSNAGAIISTSQDQESDEEHYALPFDWGKKGRRTDRPTKWPLALVAQRDAFFDYRIDPHAPSEKRRDPEAKPWKPQTVTMRDQQLGRLFGYFASDLGNFQVPKDDLSFAFLVLPSFFDGYRQHVAARREKKEGVRRATSMDKALLELMRSLFHPEYGWIAQSPEFAQQLEPIPRDDDGGWLLSAEQIAEIQLDWSAACKKAYKKYDDWVKATKVKTDVEARHRPFVSILALKDPLLAFRLGFAGVKAELDELDKNSTAYHLALRDTVLWGLQAQRAFRRKNGAWLRYDENNNGNVMREGKQWRIKISAADFKNGGGEYFGRGREVKDFDVLIIDTNGLYDLIEEYVTRSRPTLLGGRDSSAFFVGKNGKDLEEPGIVQAITRVYRSHVMWNPTDNTGIKGALKVSGLHWMRAVLATGILKLTNDRQLAADAIHDSVRTIEEHYLRFLPADRAKTLDSALAEGLGAPVGKK